MPQVTFTVRGWVTAIGILRGLAVKILYRSQRVPESEKHRRLVLVAADISRAIDGNYDKDAAIAIDIDEQTLNALRSRLNHRADYCDRLAQNHLDEAALRRSEARHIIDVLQNRS